MYPSIDSHLFLAVYPYCAKLYPYQQITSKYPPNNDKIIMTKYPSNSNKIPG